MTTIAEEILNDPDRVFEGLLQLLAEIASPLLRDVLSSLRKKKSSKPRSRSKKRRPSPEMPTLDTQEEWSIDTGFESNKEYSPIKEKPTSPSSRLLSAIKLFPSGASVAAMENTAPSFHRESSDGLWWHSPCIQDSSTEFSDELVSSVDSRSSLTQESLIKDLQAKLEKSKDLQTKLDESNALVVDLKHQLEEEIERKDRLMRTQHRRKSKETSVETSTNREIKILAETDMRDELQTSKDHMNILERRLDSQSKEMEAMHGVLKELREQIEHQETRLQEKEMDEPKEDLT